MDDHVCRWVFMDRSALIDCPWPPGCREYVDALYRGLRSVEKPFSSAADILDQSIGLLILSLDPFDFISSIRLTSNIGSVNF